MICLRFFILANIWQCILMKNSGENTLNNVIFSMFIWFTSWKDINFACHTKWYMENCLKQRTLNKQRQNNTETVHIILWHLCGCDCERLSSFRKTIQLTFCVWIIWNSPSRSRAVVYSNKCAIAGARKWRHTQEKNIRHKRDSEVNENKELQWDNLTETNAKLFAFSGLRIDDVRCSRSLNEHKKKPKAKSLVCKIYSSILRRRSRKSG